jgi:hypothetical protein
MVRPDEIGIGIEEQETFVIPVEDGTPLDVHAAQGHASRVHRPSDRARR